MLTVFHVPGSKQFVAMACPCSASTVTVGVVQDGLPVAFTRAAWALARSVSRPPCPDPPYRVRSPPTTAGFFPSNVATYAFMNPSYAARIFACSGLGAAVVDGVVTGAIGFDVSFADVHAAAVSAADAIATTPSQRPV